MKVYIVIAIKVSNGLEEIAEVFLSKFKADAFAEYYNSRSNKFYYEVVRKKICTDDFSVDLDKSF